MLNAPRQAVKYVGGAREMRKNAISLRILRILAVVTVCLALFLVLTPVSLASSYPAVTVQVTVGPCIRVAPDGTVTSNVSALAFVGDGMFTVLAR
jgi:uncharacterized protein YqfA (UPF0365 family)